MIKNKFKITGMHCTSCAFNIDGELEDTDGIEEANTSFAKAQTEVKFDPEKVSVDKIIMLIKTVGYTATLA
jgi:Cu+-exporting ATPase